MKMRNTIIIAAGACALLVGSHVLAPSKAARADAALPGLNPVAVQHPFTASCSQTNSAPTTIDYSGSCGITVPGGEEYVIQNITATAVFFEASGCQVTSARVEVEAQAGGVSGDVIFAPMTHLAPEIDLYEFFLHSLTIYADPRSPITTVIRPDPGFCVKGPVSVKTMKVTIQGYSASPR